MYEGGLRFKAYCHQTSLRFYKRIQPPRRHSAHFSSRMRRRQFRANLSSRITWSCLQFFPTPRWPTTPKHMRSHSQVLPSFCGLPLSSGTQGLQCTTHEENKRMFPTRDLRTQAPHNVHPAACRCSDAPQEEEKCFSTEQS